MTDALDATLAPFVWATAAKTLPPSAFVGVAWGPVERLRGN